MELKIKDIQPLYNMLVTTCDIYEDDVVTESGLIKEKKAKLPKEIQKVLKVGPNVTGIKPGDYICLRFEYMQRKKGVEEKRKDNSLREEFVVQNVFELDPTLVYELNGEKVFFLHQNQVEDFIVTDFEYVENSKSTIIKPDAGVSADFVRTIESNSKV